MGGRGGVINKGWGIPADIRDIIKEGVASPSNSVKLKGSMKLTLT